MRLSYRSHQNTLRLALDVETGPCTGELILEGQIDIAEQGRLVGIEVEADGIDLRSLFVAWLADPVASRYVEIEPDRAWIALSTRDEELNDMYLRTAPVRVQAELDPDRHLVALAIPRRGNGYEISFPSGNR